MHYKLIKKYSSSICSYRMVFHWNWMAFHSTVYRNNHNYWRTCGRHIKV